MGERREDFRSVTVRLRPEEWAQLIGLQRVLQQSASAGDFVGISDVVRFALATLAAAETQIARQVESRDVSSGD